MAEQPRRRRAPRRVTVLRTERLTPHMIRIVFGGPGLAGFEANGFADQYVKFFFPPPGADYDAGADIEAIQAQRPRSGWPLMRTYTVRRWEPIATELTVDFVYHGDQGLAGPWAVLAQPGDVISMLGPGGDYTPDPTADWHLLVGDESALPAIGAALEQLSAGARAVAIVEVADTAEEQAFRTAADLSLTWIHRGTAASGPGAAVVDAVRAAPFPAGRVHAFVHGDAGLVREIRRHLLNDRGVERSAMSVSGYWRRGRTDEAWREEKAAWRAALERDDAGL